MIFDFDEQNNVRITAENTEESMLLLTLREPIGKASKEVEAPTRKHRKHRYTKNCPECGKECKGNRALAQHRRFAHGVRGKHAKYHDAYKRRHRKDGPPAEAHEFEPEPMEGRIVHFRRVDKETETHAPGAER